MQVNVSRVSPVVVELQVELPQETVKAEINRAYSSLQQRARIKGFRPGKAPRTVLEKLFAGQVANDVANSLVQGSLPKALSDNTLTPINQPQVEAGALSQAAAFSYKARFEVQPELTEVVYEGFELERPFAEVDDAEVDSQLEELRARHSQLKAPEPARAAQAGDVVTIDFVLTVDGQDVKDGGGTGVQLELGTGQALPEIDAAVTGQMIDAKVEATATFSADHPRQEFRNKEGKFAITLTDIKEKSLPELDDELAKDIGGFETLVELRADVHGKLQKMHKDRADQAVAEQIVMLLNDKNPCEVPPSLVEAQSRMMLQEIIQQARRFGQRINAEQAQKLQNDVQADAERKVRAGLVMASIAKKHEFKVNDADIEKGIQELAQDTNKNVAKVRAEYREKQKRDVLIGMILEDKILSFLEEKSTITDLPKGETPKLLAKPEAEAATSDEAAK